MARVAGLLPTMSETWIEFLVTHLKSGPVLTIAGDVAEAVS